MYLSPGSPASPNCFLSPPLSCLFQAGVASDTLASLAVGVTNAIGTIVAASIIEKTGRTTLLKNSYLGQGLAMFFMAAGFSIPALQV